MLGGILSDGVTPFSAGSFVDGTQGVFNTINQRFTPANFGNSGTAFECRHANLIGRK